MADNDKISQRAHEIWEREGRPDGESERHWHEAATSLAAPEPKPVKKSGAKKATKAKADAKPAKKADKKKAADATKGGAKKKGAKKAG